MRKMLLVVAALTATLACVLVAWRRDRRLGSRFVNESINPLLVRRGLAGVGHSELGTLEHIGRRSGTRRLTPVHPVVSGEEVRIVVPLGAQSEWARNVLAAGRCRIQLHDEVLELDEPALVPARTIGDLGAAARLVADGLGFLYLRLHLVERRPGLLDGAAAAPSPIAVELSDEPAVAAGASATPAPDMDAPVAVLATT